MDAELADICQFLAVHAPFDACTDEAREHIARELSIRYLRHGSPFPPHEAGEDASSLYLFRTGAAEFRDAGNRLVERLQEGELYADACLGEALQDQAALGEDITGRIVEDSLVYLLPCGRLDHLRTSYPVLDDYFRASAGKRLQQAYTRLQTDRMPASDITRLDVSDLLRPLDYGIPAEASIREAAGRMMDRKTSGLLVLKNGELAGLITDHDLRRHCVVGEVSPEEPVARIMTTRLYTVSPDMSAFEALLEMTRRNIRHLPVVDAGRPVGLVTAIDFVRQQATSAVYLVADIERSDSPEAVARACAELPEIQLRLVGTGARGSDVQQVVTSIADAATRRLVELAEAALGPAPVPFAWVSVGSQSRREMTLSSDQDNLLLLDDRYDPTRHGPWFEGLAERVNQGLDACGFVLCPGEVMARNPQWRQPLAQWRRYFRGWIEAPERKSMMYVANFFDLRLITGEQELLEELRSGVLEDCQENQIFHAHLAGNSLRHRVPLGIFNGFVLSTHEEQADTLDLKREGLIPIVDIARLYALVNGIAAVNTLERLRAAGERGVMHRETAQDLIEAYEFIAGLRLRHQAEALRRGDRPDNYLDPRRLSSPERSHLKQAFRVVRTVQAALNQRYQGGRFA